MLALGLVVAAAVFAPMGADTQAVLPLEHSVDIQVDPHRGTWTASVHVTFEVRRPVRRFVLGLSAPLVSHVHLVAGARVRSSLFGRTGGDSLLVEADDELPPGDASVDLGYDGVIAPRGAGLSRHGSGVALERGAGSVLPAWPGAPATRWHLAVHVPGDQQVRAPMRVTGRSRQESWRTWEFDAPAPLPADSVRFEVVPLPRRAR